MKKVLRLIISIWFYLITLCIILIFFPIVVVVWLGTILFDKKLVLLHWTTAFWARVVCSLNPLWKVSFSGNNKVKYFKTYIIVSNHQSMLDILILFYLRAHYKWVSKSEVFRIPFIGWTMTLNRYIKLVRNKFRSIPKMMNDCKREIKKGSSVLIFPEGTRSNDGRIHNFKDGAFQLAIDTKAPILPIVIKATSKLNNKRSIIILNNESFNIQVLNEIPYEEFKDLSKQELKDLVFERMNEVFVK